MGLFDFLGQGGGMGMTDRLNAGGLTPQRPQWGGPQGPVPGYLQNPNRTPQPGEPGYGLDYGPGMWQGSHPGQTWPGRGVMNGGQNDTGPFPGFHPPSDTGPWNHPPWQPPQQPWEPPPGTVPPGWGSKPPGLLEPSQPSPYQPQRHPLFGSGWGGQGGFR